MSIIIHNSLCSSAAAAALSLHLLSQSTAPPSTARYLVIASFIPECLLYPLHSLPVQIELCPFVLPFHSRSNSPLSCESTAGRPHQIIGRKCVTAIKSIKKCIDRYPRAQKRRDRRGSLNWCTNSDIIYWIRIVIESISKPTLPAGAQQQRNTGTKQQRTDSN